MEFPGNSCICGIGERRNARDVLAACRPGDKLIRGPQTEWASAGLGRQPTTLSTHKDQRKLAFHTLGPESQSGGPLLTMREWFLPEVTQLI